MWLPGEQGKVCFLALSSRRAPNRAVDLWCLIWVTINELLIPTGSAFCCNTNVCMPFISAVPKTWRSLWVGKWISLGVICALCWNFFSSNFGCLPPCWASETMGISLIPMSFAFLSGELEHERGRELTSSDVSCIKVKQGISSESVLQAPQSAVESRLWRVV